MTAVLCFLTLLASLGLAERDCFASLAMTPSPPVRFHMSTRLFEAGTFSADPSLEGPPKVPASKRRVDVAKRTGVRAWVGVIDCGALFPSPPLASLDWQREIASLRS